MAWRVRRAREHPERHGTSGSQHPPYEEVARQMQHASGNDEPPAQRQRLQRRSGRGEEARRQHEAIVAQRRASENERVIALIAEEPGRAFDYLIHLLAAQEPSMTPWRRYQEAHRTNGCELTRHNFMRMVQQNLPQLRTVQNLLGPFYHFISPVERNLPGFREELRGWARREMESAAPPIRSTWILLERQLRPRERREHHARGGSRSPEERGSPIRRQRLERRFDPGAEEAPDSLDGSGQQPHDLKMEEVLSSHDEGQEQEGRQLSCRSEPGPGDNPSQPRSPGVRVQTEFTRSFLRDPGRVSGSSLRIHA